ncbi:MAG: BNR-4 repeat-containing protein, partial [Candidatus Hydrogenedentes bacterium]|nr:BNR-4 repeat-containing protein [Candidatus Hydrogenedentota bacterium]
MGMACTGLMLGQAAVAAEAGGVRTAQVLDIAPVWAGHPVGFCLLTSGGRQYVAFYDAERHMTVAARALDSSEWTFKRLPSDLVWDSHNFIVMTMDDAGLLHLAGNMHVAPLVYFRTAAPHDIATFERI